MSMANVGEICAGIDFLKETPKVCYQTAQMKDPEPLPLDFSSCMDNKSCFRKILSALKRYGKKEELCIALILPNLSQKKMETYQKDACEAGFLAEQLFMLGEEECLVHFVMHQSNDIWQQQVWLLDFGMDEVKARSIVVNKRSRPMLVQVSSPEYWHVGSLLSKERDDRLLAYVRETFSKIHVSAVFVAGTDLNEKDYQKSREELCYRRRVFLGEQMAARGACMLSRDRKEQKPYLFLNEQTLLYNVGIRSVKMGEESVYTVMRAGCNWYEAKKSLELILQSEAVLEFSFWPMMGGEPIRAGMFLNDLPKRPRGATRLLLELSFVSATECEVKVTDLGFGELYPASELCFKETFLMEEKDDGTGYDM
jgi:hypothetical protein